MNFKEEIKQILLRRKEKVTTVAQSVKITLAQRLKRLQEKRRIQNILDVLD